MKRELLKVTGKWIWWSGGLSPVQGPLAMLAAWRAVWLIQSPTYYHSLSYFKTQFLLNYNQNLSFSQLPSYTSAGYCFIIQFLISFYTHTWN